MRASHAEALKGGTADQLSILDCGDSPWWGFSYTDVKHPVKVWYGARDDRIGIGSIRCMERAMKDRTIKIIKGEGHRLFVNADVVIDVLESIANESCARGRSRPFPTSVSLMISSYFGGLLSPYSDSSPLPHRPLGNLRTVDLLAFRRYFKS